jgi:hypothetical protein
VRIWVSHRGWSDGIESWVSEVQLDLIDTRVDFLNLNHGTNQIRRLEADKEMSLKKSVTGTEFWTRRKHKARGVK